MSDSVASIRSIRERWELTPPIETVSAYTDKPLRIHWIERSVRPEGDVACTFHGVPLSKTGKEIGNLGHRFLPDAEQERLIALLPPLGSYPFTRG